MAKWNNAKNKVIYESYDEFVGIQRARMLKSSKFDPKGAKHILFDLKRFYKYVPKDAHILDVGCRDGWAIGRMNHDGYQHILGIDVVPENIKLCTKLGYKTSAQDCENLNFDDDSFDAVFCRHTLEHAINPRKALQEFVRITKSGGIIHIVVPIEKNVNKRQVRYGHSYVFEDSKQLTDMVSQLPLKTTPEQDRGEKSFGYYIDFYDESR